MSIFGRLREQLETDWKSQARPEQLPPGGDGWSTWLLLAGRGFGKTLSGTQWVRGLAESGAVSHIALVGPTASDVRDVMAEGPSGLLSIAPNSNRPNYEPTKRRITWANGVQAAMFSSEEPERLRGPQHGAALCDELCSWRNAKDTWDNLQFGLRLGKRPRQVITTTPKPSKLLKAIIANPATIVTRGSTYDNRANLPPSFFTQVISKYEGSRIGRQELLAEILDDADSALWNRDLLEACRVEKSAVPELTRVVVAIDPSMSFSETSNETGIIVAGLGKDGRGYILADVSGKYPPVDWARAAVKAHGQWNVDRIVAEVNQGGDLVENTIRMVDANVSYKAVSASRGKITRAEPVSALFEQHRVHLVGNFPELEDQLCTYEPGSSGSPDRLDAMTWAITELLVANSNSTLGFLSYYQKLSGAAGQASETGELQLERIVRVVAPRGIGAVLLPSGRDVSVPWDGSPIEMLESDAKALARSGWIRASSI